MKHREPTRNVGRVDMLLRLLITMLLFSANAVVAEGTRWIAAAGFLSMMTALFRYCPLYALLGVRTCSKADASL